LVTREPNQSIGTQSAAEITTETSRSIGKRLLKWQHPFPYHVIQVCFPQKSKVTLIWLCCSHSLS